jgi:hypothetical protein
VFLGFLGDVGVVYCAARSSVFSSRIFPIAENPR